MFYFCLYLCSSRLPEGSLHTPTVASTTQLLSLSLQKEFPPRRVCMWARVQKSTQEHVQTSHKFRDKSFLSCQQLQESGDKTRRKNITKEANNQKLQAREIGGFQGTATSISPPH